MAGAEIGNAYVRIIPRMSGTSAYINKELNGVDGAAAGKKAGSGFSGGLKGAIGAVSGAVAAIGFGDLIAQAAAASDATDKFKSTLNFAGLDTSQIDALTKSTQAYADATVYDLGDIQNITAQLAANSVKDYDKLAEAAGNLNAVAGGNADTFKSVGMVMTQTAGAGKLTTENWNQLADAIPGASGRLQEAMLKNGAYTGNFREAMENGEITAEEFNQAIMDLGFEDAAIEAARSTSTFEGAMGNLEAAAVGGMAKVIEQVKPAITGAINGVVPLVDGAFSVVAAGVGKIAEAMLQVGTWAQTAFQPVVAAFQQLQPVFQPVLDTLAARLMPALQQVGAAVGSIYAALAPLIATAISTSGPILADIANKVASLAALIMERATPVLNGIAELVQTVLPIIQLAFQNAGAAIQGVIDTVFPYIEQIINGVMSAIQGVIDVVLGIIQGDWDRVWQGIQMFVDGVWQAIGGLIQGAIETVKSVIDNGLNFIFGIWSSIWSSVSSWASNTWADVCSAVSGGIDSMMGFIGGIPDAISGFFSDAGSWLINAGRSIIDGLVNGIRGAIDGAVGAVSGAVQSIRDLFPFSPAKKGPFSGKGWVLYSGMSIAEAMGEGFERRTPRMVSMFAEGMDALSGAMRIDCAGVKGGASTVNNYYVIEGVTYAEGSDGGEVVKALFDVLGRARMAYPSRI